MTALPESAAAPAPEPPPYSLRPTLSRVMTAWGFGAVWLYITTGATLTQYAKLLHVTPFGFGLLAALPFLGALTQLPASLVMERYGWRKPIFLWANLVHRFLWIVIGAMPWLLPMTWWWAGLIGLMLLSSMCAHAATPAWMSWMADLVPPRLRARYFSRRVQFGQIVGLVVTVLMGLLLDRWQGKGTLYLRTCISLALILGGVSGIADILFFFKVPDPRGHAPRPGLGLRELVRRPLADRNFRHFLGYTATMTFATGFVTQFIWLYILDVVHMSNTRANLLLITVPLVMAVLCYPVWGRVVDRFGSKPALMLAGLLVVNGASAWILVQGRYWYYGYLTVLLSSVSWPAMELASFNLLLRTSDSRGAVRAGSATAAINSLVTCIAGTLSGVFGGTMAELLGDWQRSFLGLTLTFHAVLFVISAVLRLAALAWLLGLRETHEYAARDALRYVKADVFSNLQAVFLVPVRQFGRLGNLSFRLRLPGWQGQRNRRRP
ncbi:MAG: Major Facilitator Superfamily protein [Lentisphaerae bacterium ADurb.BinA184]|nr:MAG: Major Facilitator Superfamily protein [Lentisphaerae bacterium ADurb.BinA184]